MGHHRVCVLIPLILNDFSLYAVIVFKKGSLTDPSPISATKTMGPPPSFIRPSSPPGPPPSFIRPMNPDSDSDSDDEVLKLHLMVRKNAIELCRASGSDWDTIEDDDRERFLLAARQSISDIEVVEAVTAPEPLQLPGDDEFCDFQNTLSYSSNAFVQYEESSDRNVKRQRLG